MTDSGLRPTPDITGLDLEAISRKWLSLCGACDGGLTTNCTHPDEDYRPVMLSLVEVVAPLLAQVAALTEQNERLAAEHDAMAKALNSEVGAGYSAAKREAAERAERAEARLQAVQKVCDDENVPLVEYRAGYELALAVIRHALTDPESVLDPPDRAAARGEDPE